MSGSIIIGIITITRTIIIGNNPSIQNTILKLSNVTEYVTNKNFGHVFYIL